MCFVNCNKHQYKQDGPKHQYKQDQVEHDFGDLGLEMAVHVLC